MPARAVLALNARLALARHRRLVVAALVGLAVMTGLQVLRPADPPTRDVLVAAHDLPTGHRVDAGDLVTQVWDTRTVPDGMLARPQGLVLSGPIRRGEPLTDVRVVPTGSAAIPAGRVVVTVRLSDPASGLVVHPGERADILAGALLDPVAGSTVGGAGATGSGTGATDLTDDNTDIGHGAAVIVRDALILDRPGVTAAGQDQGGDSAGRTGLLGSVSGTSGTSSTSSLAGVLLVAVTSQDAVRLAAVSGTRTLSVARHTGETG